MHFFANPIGGSGNLLFNDLIRNAPSRNSSATVVVTGTAVQPHPRIILLHKRNTGQKPGGITARVGSLAATLGALTLVGVGTGPAGGGAIKPAVYHHLLRTGVY